MAVLIFGDCGDGVLWGNYCDVKCEVRWVLLATAGSNMILQPNEIVSNWDERQKMEQLEYHSFSDKSETSLVCWIVSRSQMKCQSFAMTRGRCFN